MERLNVRHARGQKVKYFRNGKYCGLPYRLKVDLLFMCSLLHNFYWQIQVLFVPRGFIQLKTWILPSILHPADLSHIEPWALWMCGIQTASTESGARSRSFRLQENFPLGARHQSRRNWPPSGQRDLVSRQLQSDFTAATPSSIIYSPMEHIRGESYSSNYANLSPPPLPLPPVGNITVDVWGFFLIDVISI